MTVLDRTDVPTTVDDGGVAARLAAALAPVVGGELPVRLTAWDGSVAGPIDAPSVVIRSPQALRRILWHPGELGAAQAYVTGELDVEGDLDAALTHVWRVAADRGLSGVRPAPGPAGEPAARGQGPRRPRTAAARAGQPGRAPRPAAQPRPRP